jgi:hypothetical protein
VAIELLDASPFDTLNNAMCRPFTAPLPPVRSAVMMLALSVLMCSVARAGGTQADWTLLITSARQQIAAKMGRNSSLPVIVIINATQQQGAAQAYTDYPDATGQRSGKPVKCVIHINPSGQAAPAQEQLEIAGHEAFHCFQLDDFSTGTAYHNAPEWLIEGQAEWVGATLAGTNISGAGYWGDYFTEPDKSLFDRGPDALGFYAEMEYVGINPWPRFDDMLKKGDNAAAYALATGLSDDFEIRWASSYARSRVRDPSLAPASWDADGPGITKTIVELKLYTVSNGISKGPYVAAKYTNEIFIVDLAADIVQIATASLHGHVSFADRTDAVGGAINGYFCTLPHGCKCPTGSSGNPPPTTHVAPGDAYVSMSGAESGAKVSFKGMALSSFCKLQPTPSPSPTSSPPVRYKSCNVLLSTGEVSGAVGSPVVAQGGGSVCYYAITLKEYNDKLFTVVTVVVWPPYYAAALEKSGEHPAGSCSSESKPGTCGEQFVLQHGNLVQIAVTLHDPGSPDAIASILAGIVRSRL